MLDAGSVMLLLLLGFDVELVLRAAAGAAAAEKEEEDAILLPSLSHQPFVCMYVFRGCGPM